MEACTKMTFNDLKNYNETQRPRQSDRHQRQWPRPTKTKTNGQRRAEGAEKQAPVRVIYPSTRLRMYPPAYRAAYQAALAFVDAAEPSPKSGLATAYYTRNGELLTNLEDLVRAILAGELLTDEVEA